MRTNELAARSRATADENDATVLAALARAGDTGVRPGRELADAAGLPTRTTSRVLGRLVARGLARQDGKRRAWATDAGRTEAGAGAPGLSLAPTLDRAVGCFPAEAQRAFARLALAAVPARWHLADEHRGGWAGLIALGPSKTGKTSIAEVVCRVYGFEPTRAIKVAQFETAGSLFARRVRDSLSATGYRVERSPLLELPFVCVDEWDKAPEGVRAAAGGLLLGQSEADLEGELVRIRPTVLVTLNTGPEGLRALHQAHVRRSVVLDTTALEPLLGDLDRDLHRLFSAGEPPIPRLALDRLRPAAPELPDELRELLRAELRAGLTDDGWRASDVAPLARIALGRATLTEAPLEQATLATALDYLTCAATVGHTRPGFAGALAPRLGARGALLPDPAAAEAEAERPRIAARVAERRSAAERLAFEYERERRAATLLEAKEQLGRKRDAEGKAIATALSEGARAIRGARGRDALDAAWEEAHPYLERARQWALAREQAADERRRRERDERRLAQERREARRRERQAEHAASAQRQAAARQAKSDAKRQLAPVRATARELEALYRRKTTRPREDVLATLRRLQPGGHPLLIFEPDERPEGLGSRLLYGLAAASGDAGSWRSPWLQSWPGFRGSEASCPDLTSWGQGTRLVLAAPLRWLYQREDELARHAGERPRAGRLPDDLLAAAAEAPRLRARPGFA